MPADERRAPLGARLEALAIQMQERAWTEGRSGEENEYLRDCAASLAEFAMQLREEYVRLTDEHANGITVAQSVALTRFMSNERAMSVFRGGQGLSDEYLLVELDPYQARAANRVPYTGGIDREGRVST